MTGEATVSLHDGYVLVSITGEALKPDDIKNKLRHIVDESIKKDLAIVIHRELPVKQRASVFDFYHFAELLAGTSFKRKLALVFPKEMKYDNLDFFVTTARNRGVNVEFFSTIEQALSWIKEGITRDSD